MSVKGATRPSFKKQSVLIESCLNVLYPHFVMSSKNASKLQQEEPVKNTPPTASGKDCNENEIDALFSSFNRPSNSTVSKKKGKGKQKGLEQKRRKIVKEGCSYSLPESQPL